MPEIVLGKGKVQNAIKQETITMLLLLRLDEPAVACRSEQFGLEVCTLPSALAIPVTCGDSSRIQLG